MGGGAMTGGGGLPRSDSWEAGRSSARKGQSLESPWQRWGMAGWGVGLG